MKGWIDWKCVPKKMKDWHPVYRMLAHLVTATLLLMLAMSLFLLWEIKSGRWPPVMTGEQKSWTVDPE